MKSDAEQLMKQARARLRGEARAADAEPSGLELEQRHMKPANGEADPESVDSEMNGGASELEQLAASASLFFPARSQGQAIDADYRARMHKALDTLMDRADRSNRMHKVLDGVLRARAADSAETEHQYARRLRREWLSGKLNS
jgi:hypothetical protein